jgi:TRAP transporter 4TM/12TM fusion protein
MTYAERLTSAQIVLGAGLVVVVLEAARRTVGWVLVWITVAFLVYAKYGNVLPEPFWHRGRRVGAVVEQAYLTVDGIWNVPLAVTANFIFLFVLLGALLFASGAGTFFTDLARGLTGRTVGGPAKTAVVASAFMGMLSGSSSANVVTTGSFTIPAMRKAGYRLEFAAGVEAVASTGGQLTPPIMGAAAFLMIEFAGVSYSEIIRVALIPAILYFMAVFLMVDLEARRLGLRAQLDEALPNALAVLRRRGYLLLPLIIMVWVLLEGYTPATAGFWSVASLAALSFVMDAENRRRFHRVIFEAMTQAPRLIGPITVACAIGGILAGVIAMTGLGIRISNIILDASAGILIVALFLTMVVAIVLGMGMPTSAAYVVLAALLAPGLVKMGVSVIAAHLFIIYCAAKSSITPPVAIASYAAAAVAGCDPWRTSLVAFRLGLPIFIIPYMFVYGEALLSYGTPAEVAWTFVTASFGIAVLSVASIGWLKFPLKAHERLIALAASLPMIYAEWRTDLIGVLLAATCLGLTYLRVRRRVGARAAAEAVAGRRRALNSRD